MRESGRRREGGKGGEGKGRERPLDCPSRRFRRAGKPERAVEILLSIRNYAAATPLMRQIKSPKLQLLFGQAKANEGKYQEALEAFEAAGESVQAIRLLLERLGDYQRAFAIARRNRWAPLVLPAAAAASAPPSLSLLLLPPPAAAAASCLWWRCWCRPRFSSIMLSRSVTWPLSTTWPGPAT